LSKVLKALDVELYERCRICKGSGQFKDKTCLMCEGQGFAAIGMKLLELERLKLEVNRLRAELAAVKAEPIRPAAIVSKPDPLGVWAIDAYESKADAETEMRDWEFSTGRVLIRDVTSWTWHPKSP
jgi:hypothetical protein